MQGFVYNLIAFSKLFSRGLSQGRPFYRMFKDKVGNDLKCKHIYLCRVDKYIGAYNPYTGEVVGYEISTKFVPFVQKILHDFPDYSPHNVINEGIQDEIRKKILMDIAKRELQKTRD